MAAGAAGTGRRRFRAVAADLRGDGASDKPPRGYDGYTMAADVAGLIRASASGRPRWWATGRREPGLDGRTLPPKMVTKLVVVAAAHPLRLRAAVFADPRGQFAAAAPVLKFQIPRYERAR